jgi:uncharacterized protein (TIGR02300 family)
VTKPELGTKRLCAHCGAKFYDLQHEPITCPKCSAVFEAVQVKSRGRAEPVRVALREVAPLVPTTAQSLEYAHAEAQGKRNKAGEAETGVELDDEGDEGLDDDTLIEASDEEDTDVTEIIGDDVLKKEET